ncbi:MAG: hypothetical protein IJG68_04800 [Bacilli bacterium]|nr:hypothetical protein [Bacilli bacterium]
MTYQKKKKLTNLLIVCLLFIGIVYAILTANLQINGTAKIGGNTWDIHFNNIQINENSVALSTGDSAATIDPENNCKVDFEVTLSLPGDFYEFTVDVVNSGTIDGMVQTYTIPNVPDYLDYTITYADGMSLAQNQLLSAGATETYKVRLEFKNDLEELPDAETLSTSFEVTYVQADSSAIPVRVPEADFATDSWDAIIAAYNAGKKTNLQAAMEAGTTREVNLDLDNDGTYETTAHLRIANLSTPAECSTTGFSQSACGFVIEFADVITTHRMNPSYNNGNIGTGNVGGWPASEMRTYVNSDICNALPSDLKSVIINTTVVSGHGATSGETNFTSTDKLYLLSRREVWNYTGSYDTAQGQTRQLDYYANLGVTESNYSVAIKKDLSGTATIWWLRSAGSSDPAIFFSVSTGGGWNITTANNTIGVSPAFRIAL